MIKLQNLSKDYFVGNNSSRVLFDINLQIFSGEFVALLGASGSGKSTLMNIIGLLDKPTSGHYNLDGEDLSTYTPEQLSVLRNTKFGFIFQNFSLLNQYPIWYNVALPLHYSTVKKNMYKPMAVKVLKNVGLKKYADYYPNMLSGGQQQRVAIARALITKPAIILADEPTGSLDSKNSKKITDYLVYLNKEYKTTVLLITHDKSVADIATKKIIIKDGRLF
ncbi:MAG: ABC transporter ATP-binding protein [Pseudomonadota bacterium]|nr:ABC transporter ATP-binding protein [Pseudomonadota bacterium]